MLGPILGVDRYLFSSMHMDSKTYVDRLVSISLLFYHLGW